MRTTTMAILVMSFIIVGVSTQECASLVSEYSQFGTVGEHFQWDMRKNFFSGADLKYSLSDLEQPAFSVKQPIEEVGQSTRHPEPIGKVVGQRALRQYSNGAWLNNFAFIEEGVAAGKPTLDLFFSTNYPSETTTVPQFQAKKFVTELHPGLVCLGLDYITKNIIAIDCTQEDPDTKVISNGFYVADISKPTSEINIISTDQVGVVNKKISARIMEIHTFTPNPLGGLQAAEYQLLLRGVPAWATADADPTKDKLDTDCMIEVYKVINNIPEEKPIRTLTKKELAKLLKVEEANMKFSLMDFKIQPNGYVYILDAYNHIIILSINTAYDWVFVDWIQTPYAAISYAFDINYRFRTNGGLDQHLVVVYKNQMNVYKNNVQENGYTLPFTVTYGDKVFISQKFIVLVDADKTPYLYSSEQNLLVYSQGLIEVDQLIINPYEPDLIGLSEYNAHRYLLSNGYLAWNKQQGATAQFTLSLQAKAPTGKQCAITIHYKTVEAADTVLYDLGTQPFPPVITYPCDPFPIDQVVSGPNLQYATLSKQGYSAASMSVNVKSVWDLKIEGVTWPNPSEVVFADVLAFDNQNRFHLLLQITNKVVKIWDCTHEKLNSELAQCKDQDSFSAPTIISRDKHGWAWWSMYGQLTYAFLESDYVIGVYVSVSGKSNKVTEISFEETKDKISSFVFLQQHIYVVLQDKKEVEVWSVTKPTQLQYTINAQVMMDQGFKQAFTPKKVFGNKDIKSQLIYIQTDDKLLMGDYNYGFTLMKTIDIIPGSEVAVGMGVNTFFVVQKLGDQDKIDEYNFANPSIIYLTKSLPLYWYKIQEPLTADFAAGTGFLFLRALNTKNNLTVLLVYEPEVPSHASLHKVIETGELIKGTMDMAIDGSSQMFLYLNDNKIQKMLSVLRDSVMILSPSLTSPQYVQQVTAGIQITNYPENKGHDFVRTLKVLNTQSVITIDKAMFKNGNKIFPIKDQAATQSVGMGTDWYNGQVTEFIANCEQCPDLVTIIQTVHPVTDGEQQKSQKINDGVQVTADKLAYQTYKEIHFTDLGNNDKKIFQMNKLEFTTNCHTIATSQDGQYIFSGCNDPKFSYIYVTKCTGDTCESFLQGVQKLDGVTKIAKLRIVGNTLIVLNADADNLTAFAGTVNIYQFTFDATKFSLTVQEIFDNKELGSADLTYLADFDVIKYTAGGQTYYKLLLSEAKTGLYFVDSKFESTGQYSKVNHEQFNLVQYLNGDVAQQFTDSNTFFQQVRSIRSDGNDSKLKATILVTTNNVAHYAIYMEFDTSKATTGSPFVKGSATVPFLFNQYGSWKSLNEVVLLGDYLVIPFSNKIKINLSVYSVPKENPTTTKLIASLGGIEQPYDNAYAGDLALLLIKENDKTYLNANIEENSISLQHMVRKYELNTQPVLQILQGDKLVKQKLVISAINDFSDDQVETEIANNTHHDDNSSSGSSNWWWITLLVIFGVAILGAGGYFAYNKFYKKGGVDPLLG